jgi:hypothetical protein
MRKAMVLVAMLAMMLVLAAPAYAQTFVSQDVAQFGVVDDSVSSQVFNVGVQQFNAGDQIAVADADATATAGAFGSASAVAIADANAVNVANAAAIGIHTVNVSWNNW